MNKWKRDLCISLQNALPLRSFSLRHFSFPSFVSGVVTSSPIRAGSAHFVAHIWSQNCRSVARRNLRRPWSPWLQTGCSLSGLYGHWKGDEKGIQRKYLPLLRSGLCVISCKRWIKHDSEEENWKLEDYGDSCGMLICKATGRSYFWKKCIFRLVFTSCDANIAFKDLSPPNAFH